MGSSSTGYFSARVMVITVLGVTVMIPVMDCVIKIALGAIIPRDGGGGGGEVFYRGGRIGVAYIHRIGVEC